MKKNKLLILSTAFLSFSLIACDKPVDNSNSDSHENSVDSSSSDSSISVSYDYRLEDGETYTPISIAKEELKSLNNTSISIEGIDEMYVDPYETAYFYDAATLRYPTAQLLQNKAILYTSTWYEQTTFNRTDDVIEYVILNEENIWYVDSISNHSQTFIPFNGAVLSLPKNHSKHFNVGDHINITRGAIAQYELGLYNQDGKRMAINRLNDVTWTNNGSCLFDSNYIGYVTYTLGNKLATINTFYDEESDSYIVDKFRVRNENGRIYTNIHHDGFMIGASLGSGKTNISVLEGIRFNLNDHLKVEETGNYTTNSFTFSLSNVNTYTLSNNYKLSFTLNKTTSTNSSRWEFEMAVNKNNVIVDIDDNVEIPSGGYKIQINTANGTTGESSNQLLENVFLKGSLVSISGNEITFNNSLTFRVENYFNVTQDYLNQALEGLKTYNYSYDYTALYEIENNLKEIKNQIRDLSLLSDGNATYRLHYLLGKIHHQYYNIMNATNRNEAAQVKSVWYITNYNAQDKNLESLCKELDKIKASGTNEIIVETISEGVANYKSEKFHMNNTVSKNDYGEYGNEYLKAVIAEAHKRNIKVIGGFSPLVAGLEKNYPELLDAWALSINGKNIVTTSQGPVQIIDPANQVAQAKFKEATDDILKCNPGLDGIHLDMIRYGADNNYIETVMGVTESARIRFNQYCTERHLSYNYSTLDALRQALYNQTVFNYFNAFQATQITDTVKNIKEVCMNYDIALSCAIADNYSYVKTWKCQDWADWAKKGYVDALYLMDYYFGEYFINYYFEDMLKNTENNSMLITGIDPSYANLISEFYTKTIKGGLANPNSHGYAVFGSHTQNAKKDGWDLVLDSNWIESISPYDDLSTTMKASGDLLLKRCDDIYIHYGNQTNEQKALLENDLKEMYLLIGEENTQTCQAVIDALNAMKKKTYASNNASKRINEQLDYMIKIAKLKLNIHRETL